MENNLSNLLFITVEDVKESKIWQPINDRKQSACLLAVINWYLPKGVNDLTCSASFSQGGVSYSQTNDPEANENIIIDVKNALKLAGEIIDIISSKTLSRHYNYNLDNYAHSWEEEYKHISKKTFYPTLLFWLK